MTTAVTTHKCRDMQQMQSFRGVLIRLNLNIIKKDIVKGYNILFVSKTHFVFDGGIKQT